MKEYPTEKIRNVALAGHTSSGKTTLAEALLYHLKIADRLLRVDDGNSMSDYDPEEVRRKTSINTAVLPVEYAAHKMNILDLPGYRDFIGEIKNGIRVCDTVVIVVDGIAGGEMGTELAWEMADEYDLPRVAFINKLDKEHASFEKAVRSLKDTLGIPCVPVTLPVGAEASFSAVIDLLRMKVAQETPTQKPQYGDIPADMVETAQAARAALIEAAAEGDEALIEKFLEDKPLTEEEIVRGLKMAFMERRFLPVLCGAGLKQIGLAPLLDFIVSTVPAPGERKPIPARRADNQEPVERPISADAPFSAYVFKTVSDDYAGRLSFFKVYSGSITNDTTVSNPAHRRDERIGHLLIVRGKKQEEVHRLVAGDIGAVAKLAATATSDTLCTGDLPIAYDPTVLPSRTYSRAVVVRSKADEEKVSIAMHRLIEQDPTLDIRRDPEIRQTIISGMGDTHLDVAVSRIRTMSKIEVDLETPRVAYHETITRKGEGMYRHKKQTGGRGQFAEVHIRLEPLPEGSQFQFEWEVFGGAIPTKFKPSVEKGLIEALERGPLAGYRAVDVKAACYDGKHHEVDSSDMAFKIASIMAFRQVAKSCNPIILEPIYNLTVTAPEANMGDIMGSLSGRRGRILGTEPKARKIIIKAQVPLAEMFTYSQDLRSMTGGRGSFEMIFSHYERVPGEIQAKIVEDATKHAEEQKEE